MFENRTIAEEFLLDPPPGVCTPSTTCSVRFGRFNVVPEEIEYRVFVNTGRCWQEMVGWRSYKDTDHFFLPPGDQVAVEVELRHPKCAPLKRWFGTYTVSD